MKYLITILGPTASGKTDLSIALALEFKSEIISADSRQFFKELPIGTAQPSELQLQTIPHHFISNLSVTENYDAGKFEKDVLSLTEILFKKYDILFLVGGSGLYIDALINGFDDLPEILSEVRIQLQNELAEKGIQSLQQKLKDLDPDYYQIVDLNNPQRITRALEVCISSGKPYSSFRKKTNKDREFNVIKIGLDIPREKLYQQINKRTDEMMKRGFLEEARTLLPFRKHNALQTVGYTELFDFIEGKYTLPEAIEKIKQHTRNYAKRQLTWFRKDTSVNWFNPEKLNDIIAFIKQQTEK